MTPSTPPQVAKPNAHDRSRRRTQSGTASTRRNSNANHNARLSQAAPRMRCAGWKCTPPKIAHSSPPVGCQPQNSSSAVLSTSTQAADATLHCAAITSGRPNNAQVRNSS